MFENPSIAQQMNEKFINIKVDREEHPDIDDIYMTARQMLTREGGWPNNVFLTPDLKPFYAGGTFFASDSANRPGFPRLLEWLHYSWTTQEKDVRETADKITKAMQGFMTYAPKHPAPAKNMPELADRLFLALKKNHDESSGGFFQAPKFPHEHYLRFLLAYHEKTEDEQALEIVTHSLRKMGAGGIYDHVGCGFHRYAVDKEWYVPHFEKMLYNQAQLGRVYTDAARITSNPWLANVAKSIFDFVSGPMTDGNGGFYAAIDAETDGIEGAHYAWDPKELEKILRPDEIAFLTNFYALADIPKFPGHKHPEGQVLILRKPLDEAAKEKAMPYLQLSAMCGYVMNKLLTVRNLRKAPRLDTKIIVSWNGLMIDAFAHAGKVFDKANYIDIARKAADYLLENAIDNHGNLYRILSTGKREVDATLEDYACLVKGLLTLNEVAPDKTLVEHAKALLTRADELFLDKKVGAYFYSAESDIPVRIKNGDDNSLPNANALMLENFARLYALTKDKSYRNKAESLRDYFLGGENERMLAEVTYMIQASLELEPKQGGRKRTIPEVYVKPEFDAEALEDENVKVTTALFPLDARPGDTCELIITLDIKDGWHINAHETSHPFLVPTQVDVQGDGAKLIEVVYPQALKKPQGEAQPLYTYEGLVNITARLKISSKSVRRQPLKLKIRFQPCSDTACRPVRDLSITV